MTKLTLRLITIVGSSIVTWGVVLLTGAGAIATPTTEIDTKRIESNQTDTLELNLDSAIGSTLDTTEAVKLTETNEAVEGTDTVEIDIDVDIAHIAVAADTNADVAHITVEADEDTVEIDAGAEIDTDTNVEADMNAETNVETEANAEVETAETNDTSDDVESENVESENVESENIESEGVDPEDHETAVSEGRADDSASETATKDEDLTVEDSAEDSEEDLTAEELERRRLLIEGDRLFLNGQILEAEELYRQAKDPFHEEGTFDRPTAFTNPEQLSPAGRVYWREYQSGLELGLDTRTRVPLALLLETQPEFIPGHVAYAQLLSDEDELDEALQVLERATSLYPTDPDLATTRVNALVADEQWLQAAIAARQFAILNPDDPDTATFETWADEYQDRFRSKMRRRLTRTAIGNAITGALGFALTGSWFGPLSAVETSILMIRGESAVGERIANNASEELDLIEDEIVLAYVDEIGQELAVLGGRSEFDYQFYVVAADELNAFALPGGKIFINAGAITRTDTGAELAGLIAHELAHAILSHGFQQVTRGNLTANVLQFVPYGGLVTNLTVLRYSRDMERQADRLGTYLLATSPYAADGLRNLMQTLWEESDDRSRFDWLSTHPDTPERIRNMERLIEQNGYNRYAFEDIERHLRIQARVENVLIEMKKVDLDADDPDSLEVEETPEEVHQDEPSIEAIPEEVEPDTNSLETQPKE